MVGMRTLGLLLIPLALLHAAPALAETAPLLAPTAFRVPADCVLDPFETLDAVQVEQRLRALCRASARAALPAPSLGWGRAGQRAEAKLIQALAWGGQALRVRLQWHAAARLAPVSMSARTELAAGLWWQPQSRWALNLRLGGRVDDEGDVKRRATVTGAWQPTADHMLITRWIADGEAARHEIGMRWWLQPSRISLDAVVPTVFAHDGAAARVTLSWRGFRL